MITTEATKVTEATRSSTLVRQVWLLRLNLVWVSLAVVYVAVKFNEMDYRLVFAWIVVELALGVALFVLGFRRRS